MVGAGQIPLSALKCRHYLRLRVKLGQTVQHILYLAKLFKYPIKYICISKSVWSILCLLTKYLYVCVLYIFLVISFPECGLTRCLVHDVWSVLAITASVMFSSPRGEIKQTTLLQLVRIFCQKCWDFEIFVTQLWVSCVACNAAADAENALFINLREREYQSWV